MISAPLFSSLPATITWENDSLSILDQTRLPRETVIENITTAEQVWRAIHELRVRGAPAIGVAAAYGLCVAMRASVHLPIHAFRAALLQQAAYIDSARPTAVNLSCAMAGLVPSVTDQGVFDNLTANGYNCYGAFGDGDDEFSWYADGTVSGDFQWMDTYCNQMALNSGFRPQVVRQACADEQADD